MPASFDDIRQLLTRDDLDGALRQRAFHRSVHRLHDLEAKLASCLGGESGKMFNSLSCGLCNQ